MIVPFDKVGMSPKPFSLEHRGIRLQGTLERQSPHRVELTATLRGDLPLECDRCGAPYSCSLDDPLTLMISDEIVQDKDNLDIIEFLDGRINLLSLMESELNALEGDYHFCPRCAADNTPLEMEF